MVDLVDQCGSVDQLMWARWIDSHGGLMDLVDLSGGLADQMAGWLINVDRVINSNGGLADELR